MSTFFCIVNPKNLSLDHLNSPANQCNLQIICFFKEQRAVSKEIILRHFLKLDVINTELFLTFSGAEYYFPV